MLLRPNGKLLAGLLFTVGSLFVLTLTMWLQPSEAPSAPESPTVRYDSYGVVEGTYRVVDQAIQRNQTFSEILTTRGVSPATVHRLAEEARPVFDVRHIQAGKALRIYEDDSLRTARLLVYQPDPINYVVFDLRDSLRVFKKQRPVTVKQRTVTGVITSSPYQTLEEQGANPALAVALSNVFAWQIDFYRIHRGDRFQVVYEEQWVGDEPVALGNILAARFLHGQKDYYAIQFGDGPGSYYDAQGRTLRSAFLKAPLEFSRISSRYTKRRFHPVLKRYKAHLGTDYAAPTGTPIRATGNGLVVAAGYTRGNGNYVKIKHNDTYTTGYLHMSRFASGIRRGVRVTQGQVIGYVGSTGLATGPHLCYRFWKNGTQVDPLRLDLPAAEPIADNQLDAFLAVRDRFMPLLQDEAPPPPFLPPTPDVPLHASQSPAALLLTAP